MSASEGGAMGRRAPGGTGGPSRVWIVGDWLPIFPTFFGGLLGIPAVMLWFVSRPAAVPACAFALAIALLRKELRVDPQRGECRVVWSTARLPVRVARRVSLAQISAIEFTRRGGASSDGRPEYPVTLVGRERFEVWTVGSARAARRLGERVARAAWKPLRDAVDGARSERPPEELGLCLGRRLRRRGWAPAALAPPSGARLRVRPGPETVVEFLPVEGPNWPLLFPWGLVAIAATFAALLSGGGAVAAFFILLFVIYLAARITIDWVEWHRPRQLVLGREAIECRTAILSPQRMELSALQELVHRGSKIELLSARGRLVVPANFGDGAERSYVAGLVERAAWEHSSAQGGPRTPAGGGA